MVIIAIVWFILNIIAIAPIITTKPLIILGTACIIAIKIFSVPIVK